MPRQQETGVQGPESFLNALRNPGRNLRERYRSDPLGLAERLGLKLPRKPVQVMIELGVITEEEAVKKYGAIEPGLRELVLDVCEGRVYSAAGCGPRGGGKSFGVAFIEFLKVFLQDFDALNLGGSELQADQVYQYLNGFLESDPFWMSLVKGEPQRERTFTVEDSWVRVLTASSKSVRSPHAGGTRKGKTRGGILVIDEEAECEEEIVTAALPTINTARPSICLRVSTFQYAFGSFATLIDNAEDMGFKVYRWDAFDVAAPCSCVGGCQSEEKCFKEDHFEKFIDPDSGSETKRLVHRAYCGGRARYADGWVPVEELETLWRRMRRNHNTWEVEAMGSRPTTAGHVIKDSVAFQRNIVSHPASSFYQSGCAISICVDWGSIKAGIEVWQEQPRDKHVLLAADQLEEAGQSEIFGKILAYAEVYQLDLVEIAADIGGGGNYLNPKLREEYRLPVRDVNFAEEKEVAVAAWNIYNEAGHTIIPSEHEEFIGQVRNWRRDKSGRIIKRNDHLCDTAICYFSKFVDRLGITRIRVTPRSFAPNPSLAGGEHEEVSESRRVHSPRVPLARGFRG